MLVIERRFNEVRASAQGRTIEGYAAVYNSPSDPLLGFNELLAPGCFDRAIKENDDCRCLVNHDPNLLIGRTASGTLKLWTDDRGLKFRCDVAETQAGDDVLESIRRGDVSGCSFSFQAQKTQMIQAADSDGKVVPTRQLLSVRLLDVSPVTYPVYAATSVAARSVSVNGVYVGKVLERNFPTGDVPAELRSVFVRNFWKQNLDSDLAKMKDRSERRKAFLRTLL